MPNPFASLPAKCAAGKRLLDETAELLAASPYRLRSRVHPLRSFPQPAAAQVWLKRDDELSFGASGSKVRKYASLVPALRRVGITDVAVLGQVASNNVLAAAQLLREAGFGLRFALRHADDPALPPVVYDLIRSLTSPDEIVMLPTESVYEDGVAAVSDWLAAVRARGGTPLVLPEGGSHPDALPGAMTLAVDVVDNEQATSRRFRHIFVEAGSGLTALALVIGLAMLGRDGTTVHVLCTYIEPDRFTGLLASCLAAAGVDPDAVSVRCYPAREPVTAESWRAMREPLNDFMRANGVLVDPYYSGRLLAVVDEVVRGGIAGDALVVHTGGGVGLLTYLEWERAHSH